MNIEGYLTESHSSEYGKVLIASCMLLRLVRASRRSSSWFILLELTLAVSGGSLYLGTRVGCEDSPLLESLACSFPLLVEVTGSRLFFFGICLLMSSPLALGTR